MALFAAAEVLRLQLGPMGGAPDLGYGAGLPQVAGELWVIAAEARGSVAAQWARGPKARVRPSVDPALRPPL